jgi:hypothetical protein
MLSYLFAPEVAANIMSFATESFADYRYRRRLIRDNFLRSCYSSACVATEPPEKQEVNNREIEYFIYTRASADHFNEVAIFDTNIEHIYVYMGLIQYIRKIPDHVTHFYISDDDVASHDDVMAAIQHLVAGINGYKLQLHFDVTVILVAPREHCGNLYIEYTSSEPLNKNIIDNLISVCLYDEYTDPVIDLSGCERITKLDICGDIAPLSGVKLENLEHVTVVPMPTNEHILSRLRNVKHMRVVQSYEKRISEIDISMMPVENLEILDLSDVKVTGLPTTMPNLHTLTMYESSIVSPMLVTPRLKTLSMMESPYSDPDSEPHVISFNIDLSTVENLSVCTEYYKHVVYMQNMRKLTLRGNMDKKIELRSHAALRELRIDGSSYRGLVIIPAYQPSLRILFMSRDDELAATIFGTGAIEYIDDIRSYVYALT